MFYWEVIVVDSIWMYSMSRIQLWLVQTSAVRHVPIVCVNLTFRTAFKNVATSGVKWWDLNCVRPKRNCMEGMFFLLRFCHCYIWCNLAYSHFGIRLEISHLDAEKMKNLVKTAVFSEPTVSKRCVGQVERFLDSPPPPKMPVDLKAVKKPWLSSLIIGSVKNGCVS